MVTKYDIGDSVYYVRNGELGKGVIERINILQERSAITGANWGINTYYKLERKIYYDYGEKEEDVFLTLQDAVIRFENIGKEYLEKKAKELEKKKGAKRKSLKNLIFKKRK